MPNSVQEIERIFFVTTRGSAFEGSSLITFLYVEGEVYEDLKIDLYSVVCHFEILLLGGGAAQTGVFRASQGANIITIKVAGLKSGLYFIRISNGSTQVFGRFLKM